MISERNSSSTPFPKCIGLALGIAVFVICTARAHATTYYACVNNSTGAVVIVSSAHTCSSTQHKISWNQTGPTGPAGPQGPAGISKGLASFSPSHANLGTRTVVVRTHTSSVAGYYYVNASALLHIDRNDTGAFCYIQKNNVPTTDGNLGGSDLAGHYQQISIVDYFLLNFGDYLQLVCYSSASDSSTYVYDAGITAIAIAAANNNTVIEKAAPDRDDLPSPGDNPQP